MAGTPLLSRYMKIEWWAEQLSPTQYSILMEAVFAAVWTVMRFSLEGDRSGWQPFCDSLEAPSTPVSPTFGERSNLLFTQSSLDIVVVTPTSIDCIESSATLGKAGTPTESTIFGFVALLGVRDPPAQPQASRKIQAKGFGTGLNLEVLGDE